MRNKIAAALALLPLMTASASSHVTLAEQTAKAGSDFVAVFRVGHGCGASPTVALTIEMPPGIASAHPQAKAGWTLEKQTVSGKAGIASITWRGGLLAADEFDEFAILMRMPRAPGTLIFPATQTCVSGVEHWSQAPAPGQKPTRPAPVLTVTPSSESGGSMPGMVMP